MIDSSIAGVRKAAATGRLTVLIRLAENLDKAAAMAESRDAGAIVRSRPGLD